MKNLWNIFSDYFELSILHPQFIMKSYTNQWLSHAPKYLNGELIDIGCGRMQYKQKVLKYVDSYTGLDYPTTHKFYTTQEKPDIIADAHAIPAKNKSYDSALMLQALEYMEDPQKVFSEISRILKRDGVLIFTSPFLYPIHDYPFDRYRFTDTQLKSMLKNEGFKIIKIIPQGGFSKFWIQSFLVFWFKTIKGLIKIKGIGKIVGIIILAPSIFITIFANIIAVTLAKLTKFSKADKDFMLNYLIIAKKL